MSAPASVVPKPPECGRVHALRAEVAAAHAKMARLCEALALREAKLNRLLAEDALRAPSASARTRDA
jgi:hypothetical protein